jgi:hypothetical protein
VRTEEALVPKSIAEEAMAEVASLRARIEAITGRQEQQRRTTPPAAENSAFRRQHVFSLGGNTSPGSSQTGMILFTILT